MRIGPAAKRPMIFSFRLLDWEIVDASVAKSHQTIVAKLPILIAVGAEPIPGVVVPFVSEAHGNAISGVRPELFDEPVVQLFRPFAFQKLDDFLPSTQKLRPVSPARIDCVSECNLFRIARIPSIFGQANLLDGSLTIEWRHRRTRRDVSLSFRFANRALLTNNHQLLWFVFRHLVTSLLMRTPAIARPQGFV